MNPTDFSVLLLAWDDADPGVAVLGGLALPPTLPLVYQLAARHPVLALYPHLPASEATTALEPAAPISAPVAAGEAFVAATAAPAADDSADDSTGAPGPLDAATDGPGVHLLAPAAVPHNFFSTKPASGSRLVGLEDLRPAMQGPLPTSHSLSLASGAAPGAGVSVAAAQTGTAARSQWPANAGPERTTWQAPAAPYAGAAAPTAAPENQVPANVSVRVSVRIRETFPSPPPAPPRSEASALLPSATGAIDEAFDALTTLAAADASARPTAATVSAPASSTFSPDAAAAVPAPFDEPVAEMGAAEARDLDAPENNLAPDAAPLAAASVAGAAPETETAAPEPAATWAVRQPTLNGLNFRMIQYARRAAQLVDGRQDFDVIYAPGWPAWLAALEIRNRSGRPLVLYVPALASDTAPTAERGWLLGLERMVLRRAALVLVPDAEVLRQLRARHADALSELRIVPAADEAAVQLVLAEVARG